MRIAKSTLKPMFERLEEVLKSKESEDIEYHCDLLLEKLLKVEDRKSLVKDFDLSYYKKTNSGKRRVKEGKIKTATVADIISDLMYDYVSSKYLIKQMKKAKWFLGSNNLPNSYMRGGSYLGGVCDYTEHRSDDVNKMIEILVREYMSHPRREQRLNYFSNGQRGGSMFDIVVYLAHTSGYQFMFGFQNDNAKGAVIRGTDCIVESYNQKMYSML